MVLYRTFTGEMIDLGALSAETLIVVHEVVSSAVDEQGRFKQPYTAETAETFAAGARARIRQRLPNSADYEAAMSGAVGLIFRDLYYRLHAHAYATQQGTESFDAERWNMFIGNLRANPKRLLLDRFINGGWTRASFAAAAGIGKSAVTRIFNALIPPGTVDAGNDDSLSAASLMTACQELSIVFSLVHPDGRPQEASATLPILSRPVEMSARERQLMRLGAYFAKRNGNPPGLLETQLAALYGLPDVAAAHESAVAVQEDIRGAGQFAPALLPETGEGFDLAAPDLIAFELGLAKAGRPVFLVIHQTQEAPPQGWPDYSAIRPMFGGYVAASCPAWERIRRIAGAVQAKVPEPNTGRSLTESLDLVANVRRRVDRSVVMEYERAA